MRIVDITRQYLLAEKTGDYEAYLASSQDFFNHYLMYWGSSDSSFVHENEDEVNAKRQLVLQSLPHIEQKFLHAGLSLDAVEVILFVGQGTANGHAFLQNGKPIVWIALESYHSQQQVDIFVTHELVHGLHYAQHPEFVFSSQIEKANLGRQLMTEGVASVLTQDLLGCSFENALWADFLSQNNIASWMQSCRYQEQALGRYALDHWIDHSGAAIDLFFANNPHNIWQYRAGYYLGASWVRAIQRQNHLMPAQLLSVPRNELEDKMRKAGERNRVS